MRAAPAAYDDLLAGAFFNPGSDDIYASVGAPQGSGRGRARAQAAYRAAASGQAPGAVTSQAIERIAREVRPNDRQHADLQALRDASAKAARLLREACPTQTPLTPVARLDAMRNHLQAMLDAVNTVRPALARFYDSLSDEQKAHFNIMGPQQG